MTLLHHKPVHFITAEPGACCKICGYQASAPALIALDLGGLIDAGTLDERQIFSPITSPDGFKPDAVNSDIWFRMRFDLYDGGVVVVGTVLFDGDDRLVLIGFTTLRSGDDVAGRTKQLGRDEILTMFTTAERSVMRAAVEKYLVDLA